MVRRGGATPAMRKALGGVRRLTTVVRPIVVLVAAALALSPVAGDAAVAGAQVVDSTALQLASRMRPPITPKRAFLYSLMLPGFGQSRLDRGTSGALFSSIELAALVMVRRSLADVREAKRYRIDSLPASFTVVNGIFRPGTPVGGRFTADLVRTRRLHVEDWIAVLAFNHLFSAADAFVAAQLWDVPLTVSARPTVDGASVFATIRF